MFNINPENFTVLIVDDTPVNLQILGSSLRSEKFKVEFATNGVKALEWLKKRNFDIMLLDIMMPEMSGFEVCETIRADRKFDDMPIIFLTAKADSESIIKGFELGAQDYITKPFDQKELLVRLKTHLELKYHKDQLKLLNASLEQKVAERTAQLAEANKQLEKANKELVSLDKAKAQFLRMISHEIRTPLNGILGPLHLLKDMVDSEDIVNLINILNESVKRLEDYSLTAIKITELTSGQYKLKQSELNLSELLEFCKLEIKDKIDEKQISVENNISENITVKGDDDLLHTMIKTIILWSFKYYYESSKISILGLTESDKSKIIFQFPSLAKYKKEILVEFGFENDDENLNYSSLDMHLVRLIVENHKGTLNITESETEKDDLNIVIIF
jgi:two-component system sensor histidine kinase/response regulator